MGDTTLWSVTAANNDDADPSINWAEGQAPGTVNDSARAMMAALAMRFLDEAGYVASGGSSTAYTVASPQQTITAYRDGLSITFRAHTACGATPTLNVASLGGKALRNRANGALGANEIASGAWVTAVYNASLDVFVVTNQNVYSEIAALIGANAASFRTTISAGSAIAATPVGALMNYAGETAPSGWLLCHGQAISRTTYSALFVVIGSTYGSGDGSSTFNLPDLRGRVMAGLDAMGGSAAGRLSTVFNGAILGTTGGSQTITLTTSEIPSHSHTFSGTTSSDGAHTHQSQDAPNKSAAANGGATFNAWSGVTTSGTSTDGAHTHTYSGTTSSTGSGSAHSNTQPTMVVSTIIFTGV